MRSIGQQRHDRSNERTIQRASKSYKFVMKRPPAMTKDYVFFCIAVVLTVFQIFRVVLLDDWVRNNAVSEEPTKPTEIQKKKVPSVWTRATTSCVEPQSKPFELPSSNSKFILNVSKSLFERIGKSELDKINCNPSNMLQSARIISKCDGHWEVETFNALGEPKPVGGDEFYVTYTDNTVLQESPSNATVNHPTAVAEVEYLQDGRYRLEFVSSPLNHRLHRLHGKGTIDIYFQYTCGMGEMHPPTKNDWKDGGSIAAHYSQTNVVVPPITPFQPSINSTVDLSKYSVIIPLGDSMMQQFTKPLNIYPPNLSMPLNNKTVAQWIGKLQSSPYIRSELEKVKQQMHVQQHMASKWEKLHNATTSDAKKVGVFLIGSHAWDLLGKDDFQGEEGHAQGMIQLVEHLQTTYPHMDVVLKSPCAMFVHIPMLQSDQEKKDLGGMIGKKFGNDPLERLYDRIRYMSESRTRKWHNIQKELAVQLSVPFLDIYQASFLSADHLKHRDGRHYEDNLHDMATHWFTSNSPMLDQALKLVKVTRLQSIINERNWDGKEAAVAHFSSQHEFESHDSRVIAVHSHPPGSKPDILQCIHELNRATSPRSLGPECRILFLNDENANEWKQDLENIGCKAVTVPSGSNITGKMHPEVSNFLNKLDFVAGLAHDGYVLPTNTSGLPPTKYMNVIQYARAKKAWRHGVLPIEETLPHCFWDSQLPGIANI